MFPEAFLLLRLLCLVLVHIISYRGSIQVEALLINAKLLNAEEANAKIAVIQQIIMAINSLSKVFFLI